MLACSHLPKSEEDKVCERKTENMNDPEPCGIKQEDIEQQIGWCLFLILS